MQKKWKSQNKGRLRLKMQKKKLRNLKKKLIGISYSKLKILFRHLKKNDEIGNKQNYNDTTI